MTNRKYGKNRFDSKDNADKETEAKLNEIGNKELNKTQDKKITREVAEKILKAFFERKR